MDFMHDALVSGETVRVLTVGDVYTREWVALEARKSFRGRKVAQIVSRPRWIGGPPGTTQCDQGTQFTSKALDHRAWSNKVQLGFCRPAPPGDTAIDKAFNGLVRRECLSQHGFLDLDAAQRVLRRWKEEYDNVRPHGSVARVPPAAFRGGQGPPPT
jgi:putative transposase